MSPRERVRDVWASVRPRTRRGRWLAVAGILAGAALASVVLFVGAAMAWNPYLESGLDRQENARTWAALDQSFASRGMCASCHAPEEQKATTANHAGIGCQSCHGPLLDHVLAGDKAGSDTVAVAVPTDEVCVRCHVKADGRPTSQQVIVPEDHYEASCLACHDPHTGISNPPPVVQHPLDNLPPCMTCHGPEGFKARNQRHPIVDTSDDVCLSCHALGRGPRGNEGAQ